MFDHIVRPNLPWFVAQLRPQGLDRAVDHLYRQNFKTFSPKFINTTYRRGVARHTHKPLFPGYIFVNFDVAEPGWTAINNTRGVLRLILDRPLAPNSLPSAVITAIMSRCDSDGLLLPPDNLKAGDKIRVIEGPFTDTLATIETLPGPSRISILIDLMGQKVKTVLSEKHVEKV
jgi:transcriptional antiterminator RfaH